MQHPAIIISFMENSLNHGWDIDIKQAIKLQLDLAQQVVRFNTNLAPVTVAGIDVSVSRFSKKGCAAVVVLSYPGMEIVDLSIAEGTINFPYIPGLLSFREIPLVMDAWNGLKIRPDLAMVDGQGIAHPRRLGIASHLGILLDIPTIGCAKSRLIGQHGTLQDEPGAYALLSDQDEVIGAAVRTRYAVNPLYISIGHKIDLLESIAWVLKCCRGLRLPEPTRLAHQAAGGIINRPRKQQNMESK